MLHCFILYAALSIGQAGPTADADATANSSSEATSAPDPWLLMKTLEGTRPGCFLKDHHIEISGWTDMSFTASSDRISNLPMGFNYRANDFLLQQNWLRIDKPITTENTTDPSFGFRIDTILPGTDYRFTLSRGLFSGQLTDNHGQPDMYGIDPIQFYVEANFPNVAKGMDLKLGHFFAQYGVEVNDAPGNALLSHAYTFIYDPFTHTGILTTTKLNDSWSVQAGLVLGSDVFIDPADEPTFIGSIKWEQEDKRNSVQLSTILGSGRYNQERHFNNVNIFDLVYNHQFNPKLTYNLDSLFGYETNVPNIGTAEWFGIVNYLTCTFSDKVSGTTRLELFDDEQGERTGSKGLYTALTAGISYKPRKSIILRPELRYDYNGDSRPFENKHGLFTASTDLILRW